MNNELVPLEEIHRQLKNRYDASGFSDYVIRTDWQIIRRIGVHPALATTQDLEKVVLSATKQSTKANYVSRLRSIYKHLNKMNLINGHNPAEDLPRVKAGRGVPKPVTKTNLRSSWPRQLSLTEIGSFSVAWLAFGRMRSPRLREPI